MELKRRARVGQLRAFQFGFPEREHPRRTMALVMSLHALHRGVQYQLEEIASGEWEWSFIPPSGSPCAGRVSGEPEWAMTLAKRAIEVWQREHQTGAPRRRQPERASLH